MSNRTAFPAVFWVANTIEILERFAYYGIYMGFGIYMTHLGYSSAQLGVVQSVFLAISYLLPVFSGTFADRFGFKKVLIVSYLAYLPTILMLILTRSFSGIALTMLSIGFAAGIFKPLISGTVRVVTDSTNKTLGFGIFYQMVNIGGFLGPIAAGKLRVISWNYAFVAAAISISLMLLITIFFYKEPPRETEGVTLGQKLRDIWITLSDLKFATFLVLLGIFFWLPFWCFFNLVALYVDEGIDTARLFLNLQSVFGTGFATFFSQRDPAGVMRVIGETITNDGWVIILFQVLVSKAIEKHRALPSFMSGLLVAAVGLTLIGLARVFVPALVFAGIFLFAVGEMMSSPRIQEYITWIAPKEKAGLYMGSSFLGTAIGASLSGITYTRLYGVFAQSGHPEYVWFVLGGHYLLGILAFLVFIKTTGAFVEQSE